MQLQQDVDKIKMDATVRSCDREAGESRQQVQVTLTPPTIIWMRTILYSFLQDSPRKSGEWFLDSQRSTENYIIALQPGVLAILKALFAASSHLFVIAKTR